MRTVCNCSYQRSGDKKSFVLTNRQNSSPDGALCCTRCRGFFRYSIAKYSSHSTMNYFTGRFLVKLVIRYCSFALSFLALSLYYEVCVVCFVVQTLFFLALSPTASAGIYTENNMDWGPLLTVAMWTAPFALVGITIGVLRNRSAKNAERNRVTQLRHSIRNGASSDD